MIRHPYSFVPFGGAPGREVSAGHESYKGLSGTLSCRLRAERLLTIRSYFDRPGKHPYVPASSLRGLVRTTVQMLGAGCARHISGRGELERKLGPLAPCVSENACLACRMFGFSADRSDYAWASKVRFYDSHAVQIDKWEEMRLDPVDGAQWQSHGARHTRFYFTDYQSQYPRQPAGWKVYRHAKRVMPAQTSSFRALHCVPEGTEFSFRIDYSSLTEEEFSVLCFALTLSHGCGAPYQVSLAHKLGYGKSAGLGSCTITIEDVIPLALDRYFGGSSPEKPKPSCTVIHSIMDQTPFGAFRDNLAWPTTT